MFKFFKRKESQKVELGGQGEMPNNFKEYLERHREDIIRWYNSGLGERSIAVKLGGLSRHIVWRFLKKLRNEQALNKSAIERHIALSGFLKGKSKTAAQTDEIIRLYLEERLSQVEIARRLGFSSHTIFRCLKKAGIGRANIPHLREAGVGGAKEQNVEKLPFSLDEVIRLYQEGLTQTEIAEKFGTHQTRISQMLRKAGVCVGKAGRDRYFREEKEKQLASEELSPSPLAVNRINTDGSFYENLKNLLNEVEENRKLIPALQGRNNELEIQLKKLQEECQTVKAEKAKILAIGVRMQELMGKGD